MKTTKQLADEIRQGLGAKYEIKGKMADKWYLVTYLYHPELEAFQDVLIYDVKHTIWDSAKRVPTRSLSKVKQLVSRWL